jgi:L-iditol 2-dehydrogenase
MKQSVELISGAEMIDEDDLEAAAKRLTGGRGFDVTITVCPTPSAQVDALKITGMNGRILYFGGLPAGKDAVSLSTNYIHYKQLSIHGSTRANVANIVPSQKWPPRVLWIWQNLFPDITRWTNFPSQ